MLDSLPMMKRDFSEVEADCSLYDCKASPQLIAAFEKRAVKVVWSENEVLFNSGEPGKCVYLVLAGEVGLFLPLSSMDGMGFRARKGACRAACSFSDEPYSMSAIARKRSDVDELHRWLQWAESSDKVHGRINANQESPCDCQQHQQHGV